MSDFKLQDPRPSLIVQVSLSPLECRLEYYKIRILHPIFGVERGEDFICMRNGEGIGVGVNGGSDYHFASGVLGHFPNASCVLR